MRVLVIGGTHFIGWHTVAELLAHGHEVTLLNRALSQPAEWSGLTRIVTDRRAPDSRARRSLARSWDLVIDCCAYAPCDLAVTSLLRTRIRHYTLISTCSVHDPCSASGKRNTERAASRLLSGIPLLILRLGLTVGPRDPTGRLSYWIERALTGGDALVPMERDQPLRLIDARDAAAFTVQSAVTGVTGFRDVLGPDVTAEALLTTIAQITDKRVRWRWIPEDSALAEGLRPWTQIPLWIPTDNTAARALMTRHRDTSGTEIRYRALHQTLADCLAWHMRNRSPRPEWLTPAAERGLLHRHRVAE